MVSRSYWSTSYNSESNIVALKTGWQIAFVSFLRSTQGEYDFDNIKKIVKKELKKKNRSSVFMNFPKPENDDFDDWIGIEPNSFKNLTDYFFGDEFSAQDISDLIQVMAFYTKNNITIISYNDDEGFRNWENLSVYILQYFRTNPDIKNNIKTLVQKINNEENVYKTVDVLLGEIRADAIRLAAEELGISENEWLLLSKTFSFEKLKLLIQDGKRNWKAIFNYIPTRIPVLVQIPSVDLTKVFGKKLDEEQKRIFNLLVDEDVAVRKLKSEIHATNLLLLFGHSTVNDSEISDLINANKDPILLTSLNLKKIPTNIIKMLANMSWKDASESLDMDKEALKLCSNFPSNKQSLALSAFKFSEGRSDLAYGLVKYNVPTGRWSEYKKLLEKAELKNKRDKFQNFRSIVYSQGEYKAYIAPKSSIDALLCGEATDCCMTPAYPSQGWHCLSGALLEKNQAIFVVEKGGTIFSQSWIWYQDLKRDDVKFTGVCFDSLETVFKTPKELVLIFSIMQEFALLLKKEMKLDLIWFGEQGIFEEDYFSSIEDEVFDLCYLYSVPGEDLEQKFGSNYKNFILPQSWSRYSDSKLTSDLGCLSFIEV